MKKLLFIIVAVLFANCEPKLEEIEQYDLKGTWQLSYTTVNGKEVGNHCEKFTKIHINDNSTREKYYPNVVTGICTPFPVEDIDVYYNNSNIWINGWKYNYKSTESTLLMSYTIYDTNSSSLKVVKVWRKVL